MSWAGDPRAGRSALHPPGEPSREGHSPPSPRWAAPPSQPPRAGLWRANAPWRRRHVLENESTAPSGCGRRGRERGGGEVGAVRLALSRCPGGRAAGPRGALREGCPARRPRLTGRPLGGGGRRRGRGKAGDALSPPWEGGERSRAGPSASPPQVCPRGGRRGAGRPALSGGEGAAGEAEGLRRGAFFSRGMESEGDRCSSGESCDPEVVCEKHLFKSEPSECLVQLACSHHHCAFPLHQNELCIWNTATAQVKPQYIPSQAAVSAEDLKGR